MGSVDRGSAEGGALAVVQNSGIQRSIGVVVSAVVGLSEYELIMLSTFRQLEDGNHVFYTDAGSAAVSVEVGNQRSSDVNASTGLGPVVKGITWSWLIILTGYNKSLGVITYLVWINVDGCPSVVCISGCDALPHFFFFAKNQ